MRYKIAVTNGERALLVPENYNPIEGVLGTFEFDVPGLEELKESFDSNYVNKFVGTIIGYALRGAKYVKKSIKRGFNDIVEFLEGNELISFISLCLELGDRIRAELHVPIRKQKPKMIKRNYRK